MGGTNNNKHWVKRLWQFRPEEKKSKENNIVNNLNQISKKSAWDNSTLDKTAFLDTSASMHLLHKREPTEENNSTTTTKNRHHPKRTVVENVKNNQNQNRLTSRGSQNWKHSARNKTHPNCCTTALWCRLQSNFPKKRRSRHKGQKITSQRMAWPHNSTMARSPYTRRKIYTIKKLLWHIIRGQRRQSTK